MRALGNGQSRFGTCCGSLNQQKDRLKNGSFAKRNTPVLHCTDYTMVHVPRVVLAVTAAASYWPTSAIAALAGSHNAAQQHAAAAGAHNNLLHRQQHHVIARAAPSGTTSATVLERAASLLADDAAVEDSQCKNDTDAAGTIVTPDQVSLDEALWGQDIGGTLERREVEVEEQISTGGDSQIIANPKWTRSQAEDAEGDEEEYDYADEMGDEEGDLERRALQDDEACETTTIVITSNKATITRTTTITRSAF